MKSFLQLIEEKESTKNPVVMAFGRMNPPTTGHLKLIDQTVLPVEYRELNLNQVETVWEAIKSLRVRGAPAIGVAAAYGVIVGAQSAVQGTSSEFGARLNHVLDYLATSRPTAVNLFWALDRMRRTASAAANLSPADLLSRLLEEARAIELEDREFIAAIKEKREPNGSLQQLLPCMHVLGKLEKIIDPQRKAHA